MKEKLKKKIDKLNDQELENFDFWFSTIKKDRWWDYSFLLKIIDKKLEQMEKHWDEAIYVDAKLDKKQIKKSRKMLNFLINNDAFDLIEGEYTKEKLDIATKQFNKKQSDFFDQFKLNYEKWWD